MPGPRDDDSSRLSAQKQNSDVNASRLDNSKNLKGDPNVQQTGLEAGKSAPVEEMGATEAAFHKAIGLDKVPLKGMVEFTVKRAEMEAQRAEGTSRVQNVCFTNERGENLVGAQFSNKSGTFLKTRLGETYSVVPGGESGGYLLTSLAAIEAQFKAVRLTVLPDLFGANADLRMLPTRIVPVTRMPVEAQPSEAPSSTPLLLQASVEQNIVKPREAELTGGLSTIRQESVAADGSRVIKTVEIGDKADPAKTQADAVIAAATDKTVIGPTNRVTNPTDIAGGAVTDVTGTSSVVGGKNIASPEEKAATPPPAAPLSFDLADIVEPQSHQHAGDRVSKEHEPDAHAEKPLQIPLSAISQVASELIAESEKEVEDDIKEMLDQEAIRQRIQKQKDERRRRYVVKDKDTLVSIAAKQLRDRRLADLIFEINRHIIPSKVVRGRTVRVLKARTVIYLPTSAEIDGFRGRFGSATTTEAEIAEELDEEAAEILAQVTEGTGKPDESARPSSEEQVPPAIIDRLRYTVRLGDTLKSVAMKHPALSDVTLWTLLAQVNGLSTEVDGKGQAITRLMRGNQLSIPTPDEIAQFRAKRR